MSILRFEAVGREVGTFVILDDVTAAVAHGERIGLVGANGAGKTTLLRLAAGLDEPDRGRIGRSRGLRVGFLPQEANLDETLLAAATVRDAVRSGAAEVETMERQLAAMESAGAESVSSEAYAELRGRFEALDGYHLDRRVDETLGGLGFDRSDATGHPSSLSGGEQTRAALARLVVADPDLLLLDEPTNHLDLSALEWLEQALARRDRALVVASHDRHFLDAVVSRIWELRDRRLAVFRGGYSAYAVQSEERDARLRRAAETNEQARAREVELIQRYRRHRDYSKMHEHEHRLDRIVTVEAPRAGRRMHLSSNSPLGGGPVRSGDLVVELRDLVAGFPATPERSEPIEVVRVRRLEARRGDRIGVVGPNGAGKTTLLRTIVGSLFPLGGVVRIGAAVEPGYLAQLRDAGFPGETVLDALLGEMDLPAGEARGYLARFLFRGDDVFKPVSELSGGERSRLELARLGITPANLLLLDEPTNHLDIPAREALERFLRESSATLIVVSHDRRLLQTICERLWVVEPGPTRHAGSPVSAGTAAAYEGRYEAWRADVAVGWTVAAALELESRRYDARRPAREPVAAHRPADGDGRHSGGGATRHAGASTWPGVATRPGDGAARPGLAARPGVAAPVAVRATERRPAPLSKDAYRRQKSIVEADLDRLGLRKRHLELALSDSAVQGNYVELRRLSSELADVEVALGRAEDAWLALEERAPR